MFTGIIEFTALVRSVGLADLWLDWPKVSELKIGQSVACSGVCLTVVEVDSNGFRVELMPETWEKTYFAELRRGDLVNIERAMMVNGRFDGHIVQGHCDGVAELKTKNVKCKKDGSTEVVELSCDIPKELSKYVVQKGSVALDGISLTVISMEDNLFKVGIIPHTWENTNLHTKEEGGKVHVEVDILAKYIEKMVRG